MKLLVIRHGQAADAKTRGAASDARRALTAEGRKRMHGVAKGLRRLVGRVDLIGTSPLRRAIETARIVAKKMDRVRVVRVKALSPRGARGQVMKWVGEQKAESLVAIVGHEPSLSALAGALMGGSAAGGIVLKKGGACLIELSGSEGPGRGKLCWLMTPGQLRGMGR